MANPRLKAARALLLYGSPTKGDRLSRSELLDRTRLKNQTLWSASTEIGGTKKLPADGVPFFDSSDAGKLSFGPASGVVLGISVGTESLRAGILDLNGWLHASREAPAHPGQRLLPPDRLFERIGDLARETLAEAVNDHVLTVRGKLPLLGIAAAWPTPIDRDKRPVGRALAHDGWHEGEPLSSRLSRYFGVDEHVSYTLNDANAAALAVAHIETKAPRYLEERRTRLAIVLRVAGGIGGAIMIIEPWYEIDGDHESGFTKSVLIGGADHHAGEIGHATVPGSVIAKLNRERPRGLRPLRRHRCTCTPGNRQVPPHLEAFASGVALRHRLRLDIPLGVAIDSVVASSDLAQQRALQDVGTLIGEALAGPVAMLNPATITLTGALAVEPVRAAFAAVLEAQHQFGDRPRISALAEEEHRFLRAKGAALALIRERVHRRLPQILHDEQSVKRHFKTLRHLTREDVANLGRR